MINCKMIIDFNGGSSITDVVIQSGGYEIVEELPTDAKDGDIYIWKRENAGNLHRVMSNCFDIPRINFLNAIGYNNEFEITHSKYGVLLKIMQYENGKLRITFPNGEVWDNFENKTYSANFSFDARKGYPLTSTGVLFYMQQAFTIGFPTQEAEDGEFIAQFTDLGLSVGRTKNAYLVLTKPIYDVLRYNADSSINSVVCHVPLAPPDTGLYDYGNSKFYGSIHFAEDCENSYVLGRIIDATTIKHIVWDAPNKEVRIVNSSYDVSNMNNVNADLSTFPSIPRFGYYTISSHSRLSRGKGVIYFYNSLYSTWQYPSYKYQSHWDFLSNPQCITKVMGIGNSSLKNIVLPNGNTIIGESTNSYNIYINRNSYVPDGNTNGMFFAPYLHNRDNLKPFYAPITSGEKGQVLLSSGENFAPIWQHYIKTEAITQEDYDANEASNNLDNNTLYLIIEE